MEENFLGISDSFSSVGFSILSFSLFNYLVLRLTKRKRTCKHEVEIDQSGNGERVERASYLSPSQIEEFKKRGVLVIRNFLTVDEVTDTRKGA